MTPAAIGTELTVMNVISPMAIATETAEPHLYVQGLAVAGAAFDLGMRAGQFERGLRVVVEAPLTPVDWRVTRCAIFRKTFFMLIVVAMARDTVNRRVAKYFCFVA